MSRLHRNSTGGTGTHSAGKLPKTEVSGKEDKLIVDCERRKRQASCLFSFSQISVLLLVVNLFHLFTSN